MYSSVIWVNKLIINNNIDSSPTRLPSKRTDKRASPILVSKRAEEYLFQTKKTNYIMVYALPIISKAGA